MHIPKLKRIKVGSERDLRNWLTRHTDHQGDVMIVTCRPSALASHLSSADVRRVLHELGWASRRSYTLPGNLMGHVAHHG